MIINTPYILILCSIVSIISIYITDLIFTKRNLIDKINSRSSHNAEATRSGGTAIFIVIFSMAFIYYIIGIDLFEYSLLVPLSLLLIVGLYDDIYQLDIKLKFIFQIIAAKILVDSGLIIDNLHGVFGVFELNRVIAQGLTIFIIVAIINSINFIDGIDGLALSIVMFFIIMFELFSDSPSPFINLSFILIFTLCPLFYFNLRKKSKVFLGDSGSLFLGGLVSIYTIFILSQGYIIKEQFDLHKIIFVISVLSYPIVDITRIVIKRILERRSPFKADNNHIHHFIYRKTNSHKFTTLIILVASISFLIFIQIVF